MKGTYNQILETVDFDEDVVLPETLWDEIVYVFNAYFDAKSCTGEMRTRKFMLLSRQIYFYFRWLRNR